MGNGREKYSIGRGGWARLAGVLMGTVLVALRAFS